jgi:hypothetical protein
MRLKTKLRTVWLHWEILTKTNQFQSSCLWNTSAHCLLTALLPKQPKLNKQIIELTIVIAGYCLTISFTHFSVANSVIRNMFSCFTLFDKSTEIAFLTVIPVRNTCNYLMNNLSKNYNLPDREARRAFCWGLTWSACRVLVDRHLSGSFRSELI